MSTVDRNGNVHNGSGVPGGGRFTGKGRATASGAGLEDIDATAFETPDVRTPEFTIESLRAAVNAGEVISFDPDDAGRTRVGWSIEGHNVAWTNRATIDDQGELIRLETSWSDLGDWHDTDPDGLELHDLRHKINVDRLAFAGIRVHGEDNDGGSYGNRFTGGRAHEKLWDAAQISKRIREDLKKAQEVGAIPSNVDYRVNTSKFAGGQSITVSCEGLADSQLIVPTHDGFQGRHPWANELQRTVTVIGEQWQDSEIESQTDYFIVRYYFHVDMPDERSQAWRKDEREKAAQRRAARSVGR